MMMQIHGTLGPKGHKEMVLKSFGSIPSNPLNIRFCHSKFEQISNSFVCQSVSWLNQSMRQHADDLFIEIRPEVMLRRVSDTIHPSSVFYDLRTCAGQAGIRCENK